MARTLYALVDGFDLDAVDGVLRSGFENIIAELRLQNACILNERHPPSKGDRPDDIPEWNLGILVPCEDMRVESLDSLLLMLEQLSRQTGRDFVLGVQFPNRPTEDIMHVSWGSALSENLRAALFTAVTSV